MIQVFSISLMFQRKYTTAALFEKEIESHNISETIDTALQKKDEIIDYSRHMSEVLEQYIKDKPLTAVTCSLGLGFLLGKLLK